MLTARHSRPFFSQNLQNSDRKRTKFEIDVPLFRTWYIASFRSAVKCSRHRGRPCTHLPARRSDPTKATPGLHLLRCGTAISREGPLSDFTVEASPGFQRLPGYPHGIDATDPAVPLERRRFIQLELRDAGRKRRQALLEFDARQRFTD